MKENNIPLLGLVALLVSILTLEDSLSDVVLSNSGITLYNIFVLSAGIFGVILYFHLLISAGSRLVNIKNMGKISGSYILNLAFLLTLILVPLGTLVVSSGDWLNEIYCTNVSGSDPFNPFSQEGSSYEVCQSRWKGRIMPIFSVAVVIVSALIFIYRDYIKEKEKEKDPVLKEIGGQIQAFQMALAITSRADSVAEIEKMIKKLSHDYKIRQAALNIKKRNF